MEERATEASGASILAMAWMRGGSSSGQSFSGNGAAEELVTVAATSSMEEKMVNEGENGKVTAAVLFIDGAVGDSCVGSYGGSRNGAPLDA